MPAVESAERKSPSAFVRELKSLVAENVRGQMELVSRVSALLKNAGERLGPQRGRTEGNQSALLTRLLDFNLAYYGALSSGTLKMLNGLVSAAETSLLGKTTAANAAVSPNVGGEIQVEVRQGERLKAPFVVENRHGTRLAISFEAGSLVAGGAPPLPPSHIAFEPATLTLDPKEKAVVVALIDISRAFLVGKTYRSSIRVLGFRGQEVRLAVTILPATNRTGSTGRAKPKKQTWKVRGRRAARPAGPGVAPGRVAPAAARQRYSGG